MTNAIRIGSEGERLPVSSGGAANNMKYQAGNALAQPPLPEAVRSFSKPPIVFQCSRVGVEVQAEVSVAGADVQLIHYRFPEPPESTVRLGKVRVELHLTSNHRSARANFSDRWRSQRFERMGNMYVLPPSFTTRVRSEETAPLTSIACFLDLSNVLAMCENPPHLNDRTLLAGLDIRDPTVEQLLLRLARELRHPGFGSKLLIESIVTQLQLELIRYGTAMSESHSRGGLAAWQMRTIEERINEMRAPPTLSELAGLCRISVRQLTRGFRICRGASIGGYVMASQMEHARRLLASGESIATIAQILGFSSSSNFCYAFRQRVGVPPGQFRQILLRR